MSRLTKLLFVGVIMCVLFSRFLNLDWGLPYPFHPDERNMVDGIMRLECDLSEAPLQKCLNPEFYAYGQAPLYISYVSLLLKHALLGQWGEPISFYEAALSLRIQSVLYSLITVWFLVLALKKMDLRKDLYLVLGSVFFTFQPYFIQFAHFGTTESLLMMLYMGVVFLCLDLLEKLMWQRVVMLSMLVGVSIGVKTSSLAFAGLPAAVIFYKVLSDKKLKLSCTIQLLARYALIGVVVGGVGMLLAAPHTFLNWRSFIGSMNYEFGVGNGTLPVFYTRQFEDTIPYLYQFLKIFPYSHGALQLTLFIVSFLVLPLKSAKINLLRLAFLLYFLPAGFTYTKWGRFMAPVMPLMSLIAFAGLVHIAERVKRENLKKAILCLVVFMLVLPGLAYLSVYTQRDTRFETSQWMKENIPSGASVLIETGNVMNLPLTDPDRTDTTDGTGFRVTPYDLYGLDDSIENRIAFQEELDRSDYVIIASRRVFANHTCSWPEEAELQNFSSIINPLSSARYPGWCGRKKQKYPSINQFFRDLFNEEEFQLVQTFTSYPQIKLWVAPLLQLSDEKAEEAWTVFDHPTVRIYKRL